MNPLIYGSVCSGIETATVAWSPLGWKPSFFSEIEKNPRAVLAHHWPQVPLHGDFTTIESGQYEKIDLLVGGTPCQDFSVAGLRKGLAGDRGVLTIEFVRLAERLRPQWLVWENVPGVLSSDKGRAFGLFLHALGELGYGTAYRVLDAQYYGVAQRRRRVFLVGYLGDWRPPAAVLFDGESLSGNPPPSREAGKGSAPTLDGRSGRSGANEFATSGGLAAEIGGTLTARTGLSVGVQDAAGNHMVAHTLRGEGHDASEDGTGRGIPLVAGTVSSKWAKGTGGPAGDEVQNLIAFDCKGSEVQVEKGEISQTLRGMDNHHSHINGGGHVAVAYDLQQITSKANRSNPKHGDPVGTLHAQAAPAVSIDLRNATRDPEKHDVQNRQGVGVGDDKAHTLTAGQQGGVATQSAIRRLTPRECERLQGFPDDHTLVPIGKKKMSDAARYQMIGNAMARPVMEKIGRRIDIVRKLMEEQNAANQSV